MKQKNEKFRIEKTMLHMKEEKETIKEKINKDMS